MRSQNVVLFSHPPKNVVDMRKCIVKKLISILIIVSKSPTGLKLEDPLSSTGTCIIRLFAGNIYMNMENVVLFSHPPKNVVDMRKCIVKKLISILIIVSKSPTGLKLEDPLSSTGTCIIRLFAGNIYMNMVHKSSMRIKTVNSHFIQHV